VLQETPPPRLVVYGLLTQHEARNVATYDWLRGLALTAQRGHVAPPYVTLSTGETLERHPPQAFSIWSLADHLVTVRMADDAYMHLLTYGRGAYGFEATKRLIGEMNSLAQRHGVAFVVAFLVAQDGKKDEYVRYLRETAVNYIDCVRPLTEENRIPGEGHPNGALNSVWAECISSEMPRLLG
jgi:hypothetical protein